MAGKALLWAEVSNPTVAVLDVVPTHEFGRPGPCLVQAGEAVGGELGPLLGGPNRPSAKTSSSLTQGRGSRVGNRFGS
jgi:hypothetical protein